MTGSISSNDRCYRFNPVGSRGGLEGTKVIFEVRGRYRIKYEPGTRDAWREFPEQLDPFAAERGFDIDEPRHVAAWPRQTGNKSAPDWIRHRHEHDRDLLGFALERRCNRCAMRDDQIGL